MIFIELFRVRRDESKFSGASLTALDVSPPVDRFYFRTYEGSAYIYIVFMIACARGLMSYGQTAGRWLTGLHRVERYGADSTSPPGNTPNPFHEALLFPVPFVRRVNSSIDVIKCE